MADSDGERALRGLKHFAPESVRMIRAALDNGCTADELKTTARNNPITRDPFGGSDPVFLKNANGELLKAIDYMAANAEAGAVVWDGNGWNWK